LRLAGRPGEALKANEAWVAVHPAHVPAGLMRAVLLQAMGRTQEALQAYNAVLNVEPENLVALNNAAWVSHELGEPGALSFAERAYDAGADNAAVLDTLGWILLARGQEKLAVEPMGRGVRAEHHWRPDAPSIIRLMN
jgi:tetratricopeptide (TPR) repeat protein